MNLLELHHYLEIGETYKITKSTQYQLYQCNLSPKWTGHTYHIPPNKHTHTQTRQIVTHYHGLPNSDGGSLVNWIILYTLLEHYTEIKQQQQQQISQISQQARYILHGIHIFINYTWNRINLTRSWRYSSKFYPHMHTRNGTMTQIFANSIHTKKYHQFYLKVAVWLNKSSLFQCSKWIRSHEIPQFRRDRNYLLNYKGLLNIFIITNIAFNLHANCSIIIIIIIIMYYTLYHIGLSLVIIYLWIHPLCTYFV